MPQTWCPISNRMHYKHLFFDMDGTVTPSRSKIHPKMKDFLISLDQTIGIISGSHNDQMAWQMDGVEVICMGQNGNHAIHTDGTELWFDKLSDDEKREILSHSDCVWGACTHAVPDEDDLIEDRGSQISLSIYGHNADTTEKKACDGDFKKRAALLEQFPFESATVEVKMGGSTCLDYFRKGRNKGYNIARLIEHQGWNKDECIFFGDALFPGGNDETVVGVIEAVQVADDMDCLKKLKAKLS